MAFRQIKSPALADKAVINTKLDESAVQGQAELQGMLNPADCFTLLYDVGSDSLKKIGADDFFASFSTDDLSEGSNLYFTDARAKTAVAQDIADAVATETSRAQAAETLLQQNIDAEAATRLAADNALQADIDAEVVRATAREDAIELAYQTADSALTTRIDNIVSNTDPAALDSLAEIVVAFQDADSVLTASTIANSTAISNEVTRATTAEADLQSQITAEVSARTAGDTALTNALAAEEAARIAGDNALDARMTTEEGNVDNLQTDLAAEVTRATAAEAVLTQDLADEVTRATAAEAANAQSIQDEISARAVADTAVRTDMTALINSGDAATLVSAKAHDDLLIGDATVDGTVGNTVTDRIATAKAEAKSDAEADLAAETAAREAADSDLQAGLDAEIARATAAESTIATDLANEVIRATGVESGLRTDVDAVQSQVTDILGASPETLDTLEEIVASFQDADSDISALVSSNTTAIATEASTRAAADTALQNNIDAEAATRGTADAGLQTQIDNIELDYVNRDSDVLAAAKAYTDVEADAHQAVAIAHADAQDTALIGDATVDGTAGNTITARILTAKQEANTFTTQQLATETAARIAADDALSLRTTALEGEMDDVEALAAQNETDIRAEEVARATGDATLQSNIDSEATARANADTVLQNNIDAEIVARSGADSDLSASIAAEIARATGIESGLRTDVNTNTASIATNATNLTNEVTRAQAAEAANAQAIADEVTRATGAESTLQANIDAEVTRATGVESGLRTDVDANEVAISGLDSDLSAEIARATAAELTLTQDLAAEVTRATGIESGLRTDVDAVTTRVDNIVGTSPETLDTLQEIVAAFEDADSDLQNVISANSGRLTVNEGDIDALEVRATDLESRATLVEGRATALETEQSAQGGRLTVNEGDIDALEAKVGTTTLATVATTTTGAINELHTELDGEVAKVATLESEMDAVEARATSLEGRVDGIDSDQVVQNTRLTTNEADIDALEAKVGDASVVLDTVAQTLVGGINEVHGELDAAVTRIDGHDSDVSSLQTQVTAEVTRATGEEALIRAEFAAADVVVTNAYIAADAVVTANASADATTKANNAEAAAKTYADGIVAAEATLRENADDVLDAKIDTEINARQVADNALDSRVTVVETEMTATQTAAGVNADGTYAQPSGTNYIDLSTSLADADAKLDAAIKAVDNSRSTVEASLQAQIDAEEAARIAGDSDLTASLAAEVSRATAAEQANATNIATNATAIATESSRAQGVESSLQNQIDFITSNTDSAALDSLTEIVTAFQSADGTMQGLITQNQTDIAANATAIATETSTRIAEDAAIRGEFAAADIALQTQIDGKVSKSGDTMSGVLNMGNNQIVDVANGVNTKDAVNKGQLDAGLAAQHISQFTTDDLTEGSNLYYTDARSRAAFSVTDVDGEGDVSYDSATGVLSVSTGKAFVELEDVTDSSLGTDKAGYVARVRTDGTGIELVDPAQLQFNDAKRQTLNGDGAQTVFALNFEVVEANAFVFVGGVIQDPSTHYSIDSANQQITFTSAIPVGTQAVIIAQSTNSVGVLDPKSVGVETFADNIKPAVQSNDVLVGTSATVVSSFNASTTRAAKFIVTVDLNGEHEVRECMVVHDGTTACINEYGIVFTGSSLLGDTDVQMSSGSVELTYTAVSAGAVVKVVKTSVDV